VTPFGLKRAVHHHPRRAGSPAGTTSGSHPRADSAEWASVCDRTSQEACAVAATVTPSAARIPEQRVGNQLCKPRTRACIAPQGLSEGVRTRRLQKAPLGLDRCATQLRGEPTRRWAESIRIDAVPGSGGVLLDRHDLAQGHTGRQIDATDDRDEAVDKHTGLGGRAILSRLGQHLGVLHLVGASFDQQAAASL